MSEFGEAVGSVVEGGMVARAVEPKAGANARDEGHSHEGACLNCGAVLVGPHCHACGQRAHVHRTLGAFFHDLLHGVLHFEGKTWRTLPMLAWKPGQLTREYIDGKRAKYISPIALFLFVVFVSFALLSALGGLGDADSIDSNLAPATREQLEANVAQFDQEIARQERALEEARADPVRADDVPALESELEASRKARSLTAALVEETAGEADPLAQASAGAKTPLQKGFIGWIDHGWKKAKANPGLVLYKLQTNAYKLSWLLIPLSLPFMWLLFPFSRRFRMYDHTVFVTYSIAFMMVLIVISSMGGLLNFTPLILAPMFYAPIHLYWQLRGTYGLSRKGALWRLLVLSIFIWVVILLFAVVMIGMVI